MLMRTQSLKRRGWFHGKGFHIAIMLQEGYVALRTRLQIDAIVKFNGRAGVRREPRLQKGVATKCCTNVVDNLARLIQRPLSKPWLKETTLA